MQPHDFLSWLWSFSLKSMVHFYFLIIFIIFCLVFEFPTWNAIWCCRNSMGDTDLSSKPNLKPSQMCDLGKLSKVCETVYLSVIVRKDNNSYFSRVCVKTSGNNVSKKSLVQYLKPKRGLINVPPLISFYTRLSASQSVCPGSPLFAL